MRKLILSNIAGDQRSMFISGLSSKASVRWADSGNYPDR